MAEVTFNLPDLGEGLEEAEIVEWHVAVGDTVELNQPLCDVHTEKALAELPSPHAGEILKLHAEAGDVVEVGAPLVTFAVTEKRRPVLVGYGPEAETDETPQRRTRLTPPGGPKAAPPVRRLARRLGVDLEAVDGTGPDGRITEADVEAAASGPTGDRIPLRGVRRMIADRMAESWRTVPHVTTYLTVDATELERRRGEMSVLPFVVRALVEVCKHQPKLNASLDGDEIVCHRHYHVGVAAQTDQGLMVPVLRDADEKTVTEIATEIGELARRARAGKATRDELSGATITVSNVGTFGAEYGTPIINPPEVAILALGIVEERPMVVRGKVEARPATTLSLSFDHRVLDGAEAGGALAELREHLEDPDLLDALPMGGE